MVASDASPFVLDDAAVKGCFRMINGRRGTFGVWTGDGWTLGIGDVGTLAPCEDDLGGDDGIDVVALAEGDIFMLFSMNFTVSEGDWRSCSLGSVRPR